MLLVKCFKYIYLDKPLSLGLERLLFPFFWRDHRESIANSVIEHGYLCVGSRNVRIRADAGVWPLSRSAPAATSNHGERYETWYSSSRKKVDDCRMFVADVDLGRWPGRGCLKQSGRNL